MNKLKSHQEKNKGLKYFICPSCGDCVVPTLEKHEFKAFYTCQKKSLPEHDQLLIDLLEGKKTNELNKDLKKCSCVYNGNQKIGECLRCVKNSLYDQEKGKNLGLSRAQEVIRGK